MSEIDSTFKLQPPHLPFTLPKSFKGMFNGFIYGGKVDATDPVNNQIQAYVQEEDGSLTEIAQPIKTNSGGFPVYNGMPATILFKEPYSLIAFDKNMVQQWYVPNMNVSGDASQAYVDARVTITFDTVAEAIATPNFVTYKLGDRVQTRAYNAELLQQWKVVDTLDASQYQLPIAGTNFYLQEVSNVKYYESFGAFGNGTDLDDDAFEFAHSYNGKTNGRFGSEYLVSKQHDLTNSATIYGGWAKVKLQGNAKFAIINSNCRLGELDLDGLDGDHTAYAVQLASPSENAKVGDMIYRNFHGSTSTQTYPLMIPAYGAKDFECGNQSFYNILQDDDGAVTGKGFVGGVYLVGLDVDVPNGKSNGKVGNVYGDVVKSVDAGSGVVQDSDLVRSFAETNATEDFDIEFGDVSGRNVYKRIVKAASIPGVKFGDVKSFNPEEPAEVYSLHAAVECLSSSINNKFGDVYVEGPSDRAVWMKGNGNTVGRVYDGAGCQAVIFGETENSAISCNAGDIIGRGLNNAQVQGTGVTFYNADKCNTGNVTGLFAASVSTNEANSGHNTTGDITTNGRVNISHGYTTLGPIDTDITTTPVAGSHYILGENAKLTTAEITTDGRVTMSVVGNAIDVDLGQTRIVRASAANGDENNHSVFTTASANEGRLRGKIEIEVNATIAGTPSGSAGKSLAYVSIPIDDFDLSMNVTASSRGATGYHYWLNGSYGQANRIAVKSAITALGAKIDGKYGISKLDSIIPGAADIACSDEVNIFASEKTSTVTVTGAAFNSNQTNTTR